MPIISPIAISAAKGKGGIAMSAGEIAIRAGNTIAWYDFTDATTLTDDGGGLISSWRDKLLSGHNLLAAGAARPTLNANGIRFNGTSNYMKTAGFVLVQPAEIYMVVNPITWTNLDYISAGDAGNGFNINQYGSTPNLVMYAGTGTSPEHTGLTLGSYHVLMAVFNAGLSFLQVDGVAGISGNFGTDGIGGFTLASNAAGSGGWGNIEVKEIVIRDTATAAGDRTAICDYLSDKYGI